MITLAILCRELTKKQSCQLNRLEKTSLAQKNGQSLAD